MGSCYRQMVKEVHECLDNLGDNFPQLKGLKYEIRGFVCFHGWNDMCAHKKEVYDEYHSNFVHLVQDLRAEFKFRRSRWLLENWVLTARVRRRMPRTDFVPTELESRTGPGIDRYGWICAYGSFPSNPALSELPKKLWGEEQRGRNEVMAQVKVEMKDKPGNSIALNR